MDKNKLNSLWLGDGGDVIYKIINVEYLAVKIVAVKGWRSQRFNIVKDGGEYTLAPRKIKSYGLTEVGPKYIGLKLWLQL